MIGASIRSKIPTFRIGFENTAHAVDVVQNNHGLVDTVVLKSGAGHQSNHE